jgi:hypothetical protein
LKGKGSLIIAFDAPPDDLPGTDDDGLIWFECNPDYDDAEFEPDRQRKTKAVHPVDAEQKLKEQMDAPANNDNDDDDEDDSDPSPDAGQQRATIPQEMHERFALPD